MEVGRDLKSCTTELGFGRVEQREAHPFLEGYQLTLVDTPGFDGSSETDFTILEKISTWLKES